MEVFIGRKGTLSIYYYDDWKNNNSDKESMFVVKGEFQEHNVYVGFDDIFEAVQFVDEREF